MPVIPVKGHKVHVQELNKEGRNTIVMIHGMFSNLAVYYFNIAPVLAERYHVLLYDLKSHGMSEKRSEGYDLESMTDDLSALLDTLQLPRVHLAGYSFGGLIALKMAMRFPERIDKLALMEVPDPNDDKTRDIIDEYSKEFLINYINNFTDTTKLKMGKRQLERNHQLYEYLFHKTSIKNDMLAGKDFFNSSGIAAMPHSTLLLYGTGSNCLNAGTFLQNKIARSTLKLITGDHNIPIQEPLLVSNELLDFFNE